MGTNLDCCEFTISHRLQTRLGQVPSLCDVVKRGAVLHHVTGRDTGRREYFRLTLSEGLPSDELRFFTVPDLAGDRIEYWLFSGAESARRNLTGYEFECFLPVWQTWLKVRGRSRAGHTLSSSSQQVV